MSTSPHTSSSGSSSPSALSDSPTSPSHHPQHSHSLPHHPQQHRHQSQADRCSILQACEPCRKKKRMCNNQNPCQGCRETKQECYYHQQDLPRSISFAPTSSNSTSSSSASGSTSGTNRRLSSGSACETCRRRKTKCDGGTPCNFCAINNIECVNNSEKRRRSIGPAGDVEALEERLRKLESLVTNLISPSAINGMIDSSINGLSNGPMTPKQQHAAMQARLIKLETALHSLPQLQNPTMMPLGHPHSPGSSGPPGQRDVSPSHIHYQTQASYMDPQPHHQYVSSYGPLQISHSQAQSYQSVGALSPPSLSPLNISSPAQTPPPSEHTPPSASSTSPSVDKSQHPLPAPARSFPPSTNGFHGQQPMSYSHSTSAEPTSGPVTPAKSGPNSPIPSPPAPGTPGSPAGLGIAQIPSLMDQLSKRTFNSPSLTLPPLNPRATVSAPVTSPGYHTYGSGGAFSAPQPSPPISGVQHQSMYSGYSNTVQPFGLYSMPLTPTSPTTPRKGSSSIMVVEGRD